MVEQDASFTTNSVTPQWEEARTSKELVVYRFGEYELNTAAWELSRNARVIPIASQALSVLAFLIENRERVVPRDELLDVIWKGTFVQDGSLTQAIWQIRHALGEDKQRSPQTVKTVRGRGYRFVADVISSSSFRSHAR